MVKNTLLIAIALCAAAVSAADPVTTQIFLAGFDQQNIVGSVIASDATATTFAVSCADSKDAHCGIPPAFVFTQGPSTIHYTITHAAKSSDDFSGTIDVGCRITADHGTCSKSVNAILGTITSTATSSTTTFSGASAMGAQILTVTGGKLVTPTTASSTSSTSSKTSSYSASSIWSNSSSSSTITVAPSTSTSVLLTSSPAPSAGVSTSSVSTGGMPMVTGSAMWVMGGAAAVVAFAAL